MKENYVYPVRTEAAEDGIVIIFPDFPDLVTFAEKREDVIRIAQEALALKIMDLENRQESRSLGRRSRELSSCTSGCRISGTVSGRSM